ncbi:MAG: phospholipase D-like domain-containing protein [Kofleriaceae bacterium]
MRPTAATLGMLSALLVTLPACATDEAEIEDGEYDVFPDGKADGGFAEGSVEALGVLAMVNDAGTTASSLKSGARVTTRVATNIVQHRDGADATFGTADDDRYDTLRELDGIPYVGPAALHALVDHARNLGFIRDGVRIEVVFSPQPGDLSHNARIAQLIRGAQHSVDIAIYSYSDAAIASALTDATTRGVAVRFLFETAKDDKGVTDPTARAATKSGRLEAAGIDVRYVNKILHHKFAIIDGPRDVADRAASARLVSGSANWSSAAGTLYDENTFLIEHSAELAAAFQHEFDALWLGSRDFTGPAAAQGQSTVQITPAMVADEPGVGLLLTRANFTPTGSDGTTWRVDDTKLAVSDQFVAAIARAESSIYIGSGHMRLRPLAEALIAKKQANPAIDIRVYLDQQEYISALGDTEQRAEVDACLAAATTPAAERGCLYNDFLFSKSLVDAGIELRFKSYAYRWDHTYAVQMHSKYMIVDGTELLSGSYNLSMNAEHNSFENALHVSGPALAPVVSAFQANFMTMWEIGRAQGLLATVRDQIATAASIPLVFPSMALTYAELDDLKSLILTNCPVADSDEYKSNPGAHKVCPR